MGKFADEEDVTGRFEGEISPDRMAWVVLRIEDVEAELIGLIPSLGVDISTIDAARLQRAKRLVSDKVLELYRNPDGAATVQSTSTMGPLTETESRYRNKSTKTGVITFSDDELRSLRLPKKRANRFGSIPVSPWGVPGGCR